MFYYGNTPGGNYYAGAVQTTPYNLNIVFTANAQDAEFLDSPKGSCVQSSDKATTTCTCQLRVGGNQRCDWLMTTPKGIGWGIRSSCA